MKRFLSFFSISLILAISFSFGQASSAAGSGTINDIANIREKAVSGKIVRKLAKGAKIAILEEKGAWYRIADAKNRKGWVASWLVDREKTSKPAAEKSASSVSGKKAKLLFASRIRKAPAIDSGNVITTLYPGEIVDVTGEKGDWYTVSFASAKNGWVAKELVEVIAQKAVASKTASSSMSVVASNTPVVTGIPGISSEEVNAYWLGEVNSLRKERGLRELASNSFFVRTASFWSSYMSSLGNATHDRPGGESMHEWINAYGAPFSERNSDGGWKSNYFSENIAYQMNITPDMASVSEAMDSILRSFLREGESGVHYRTTYHPDWNSVGVGVSAMRDASGRYTAYFTFHYGSLTEAKK